MVRPQDLNKLSSIQNDRLVSIEQGRHAQAALGYTQATIARLEQAILTLLISKHHSGNLSEGEMRGAVGEIAGLRRLATSLIGDIRRGEAAAEKEIVDAQR